MPRLRLSRLRTLGWTLWDPIGLLDKGETWMGKPFADEYDSYLRYAAALSRRGASTNEITAYLVNIEAVHMGLGETPDAHRRAERVVQAIQTDTQLWTNEPSSCP